MSSNDAALGPTIGEIRIDARSAVTRLAMEFGSRLAAKDVLADLLNDGEIIARAGRDWVSEIEDIHEAWQSRHDADASIDVELDPSVWQDSVDWLLDQKLWRWPKSRFVITLSSDPVERRFLEEINFSCYDIEQIAERKHGKSPGSKRGPNADVLRWSRFWLEVVRLAKEGELNRERWSSKAQLNDAVRARLGASGFSQRTLEPWIAKIWDQLIAVK